MEIKGLTVNQKIKSLITCLSPRLSIYISYFFYFKRLIPLGNPKKLKTIDEKIQWLKLHDYKNDPIYTECADKYLVRDYIVKQGCEEILNGLIGVYNSADEIPWDNLPNKFVLKWNFGNGFNIVCPDKNNLDIEASMKQLNVWGKIKSHLIHAESQYKNIPKKIICEKYLEPKKGKLPDDYKIYCFDGKPLYMFVCVGRELGKPKFYFFDRSWKLQRINKDSINAPKDFSLPKPEGIDDMFEYAEKLSRPFKFVRADFYLVDGKVYFGELTFTPGGGFDIARLPQTQILLGNLLKL